MYSDVVPSGTKEGRRNCFELLLSLDLANVLVLMFSVMRIASALDDPMTKLPFRDIMSI